MTKKSDPYREALAEAVKMNADNKKVFALLNQAEQRGNAQAAYALGTWYLHGTHVKKDRKRAVALLEQAAAKNIPDALHDLAVCYDKGAGVKKNRRLATWYRCRLAQLTTAEHGGVVNIWRKKFDRHVLRGCIVELRP